MSQAVAGGGRFDVAREADVMVVMRDGVELATDIYRPIRDDDAGPLPVILERTPYDKSGISRSERTAEHAEPVSRRAVAEYFASHGYVVAMQDCRGRYRSGGTFHKYVNEAEDGFDTLAWLVQQTWCDGRVGTMGLSYGAHTQCALACLNPPGLAGLFIDSGGFSSAYHSGIRQGGAFELKQATWAYRHALLSEKTRHDPERRRRLEAVDLKSWFRRMPWSPGDSPLAAAPEYEAYFFEQWRATRFTDDWRRPGLFAEGFHASFPDVPVAIVGSWYDPYVAACLTNYIGLTVNRTAPVTLLMGPWTHGNRSVTWSGDADFGPDSTLDGNIAENYFAYRLQWFKRCFAGDAADPAAEGPPVRYFQMGGGTGRRNGAGRIDHGGRWRTATAWPPAFAVQRAFYLQPDFRLDTRPPAAAEAFAEYRFDPGDPVPTIGGAVTSGEPVMQGGAFDQVQLPGTFACLPIEAPRALADREDVLVFETAPLESDLLLTGAPVAELWVASDQPDTDFTVKLIDVYPPGDDYPNGFAMNVSDGIFRMRCRDGWEREARMTPGGIYAIRIEPFATSNLFRKGHRLRIDISSSNYPRFDINPNSGEPPGQADTFRVATNRVYCCASYASRIHLPIDVRTGAERQGG